MKSLFIFKLLGITLVGLFVGGLVFFFFIYLNKPKAKQIPQKQVNGEVKSEVDHQPPTPPTSSPELPSPEPITYIPPTPVIHPVATPPPAPEPLPTPPPAPPTPPTIKLGNQVWMKYNLNVGTMINTIQDQSNNAVIEKHCYDNDLNNCDIYGGLYQWDEMMQYSITESTQGICPNSFHVPSDTEWKTLEIFLGMDPIEADKEGNRGTDQGAQMLLGGWTGLDFPISGYSAAGAFYGLNFRTWIWSSSQSSIGMAWHRGPQWGQVSRDRENKIVGSPVRCLQN